MNSPKQHHLRHAAAAGLTLLITSCADLSPAGNVALAGGMASIAVGASGDHAGAAAIAQGTLNAVNDYNTQTQSAAKYGNSNYQTEGDTGGYFPGAPEEDHGMEGPAEAYANSDAGEADGDAEDDISE